MLEIPKEHKTNLWLSTISTFVSIVVVYEGCQVNWQCQIPLSTSLRNVTYAQKPILLWALSVETTTFGSLKIDVVRVFIELLRFFLILICINDLTLFTHSERVCKFSFSRFVHCLAYFQRASIRIFSQRVAVDNVKITSNNVATRIIYEWWTSTCPIRRLKLGIVNIEIVQHRLVDKYFRCNRCGIGIRNYRYELILKLLRNVRFDWFIIKDIAKCVGIDTFAWKRKSQKEKFVYFIFLNANDYEEYVTDNIIMTHEL